jgi:cytochrome P450
LQRPTLVVSDLRAISHILKQTDVYEKPEALSRILIRLSGNGLLFAEGESHRIQRKVLNPAFGPSHLREQTGYSRDTAEDVVILAIHFHSSVTDHLPRQLKSCLVAAVSSNTGSRVDMHHFLEQATLDIIGLAGFGYDFKALKNGSE